MTKKKLSHDSIEKSRVRLHDDLINNNKIINRKKYIYLMTNVASLKNCGYFFFFFSFAQRVAY